MTEPALDTRSDQYRPHSPQNSQYYQCIEDHFETFEQVCDDRFARQYGFFRPYVKDVVYRYLDCGILHNGFARVKCSDCGHEYLLAFVLERSGNPAASGTSAVISVRPAIRSGWWNSGSISAVKFLKKFLTAILSSAFQRSCADISSRRWGQT